MRKIILFFFIIIVFSGCNGLPNNVGDTNSQTTTELTTVTTTTIITTTTKKPVATKAPAKAGYSSFQNMVVELVNIERAKKGLKVLSVNANLSDCANAKSEDMANKNYFDHNSPTYGSPFDMMKSFGISYRTAGENIAKGQTTPEEVMKSWMNSQGHRENILKPSYTKIGVGVAKDSNGQILWTQQFIG